MRLDLGKLLSATEVADIYQLSSGLMEFACRLLRYMVYSKRREVEEQDEQAVEELMLQLRFSLTDKEDGWSA